MAIERKTGESYGHGEVRVSDVTKVGPDLKAPLINLPQSKFDALYVELKLNNLPEKVLGEWDI